MVKTDRIGECMLSEQVRDLWWERWQDTCDDELHGVGVLRGRGHEGLHRLEDAVPEAARFPGLTSSMRRQARFQPPVQGRGPAPGCDPSMQTATTPAPMRFKNTMPWRYEAATAGAVAYAGGVVGRRVT